MSGLVGYTEYCKRHFAVAFRKRVLQFCAATGLFLTANLHLHIEENMLVNWFWCAMSVDIICIIVF